MAVKRKIPAEKVEEFEKELLGALRRDADHQFAFDGKLRFRSSRYGCEVSAVNVHLDPATGEAVLVGAVLSGKIQVDMSKGYPVIRHEVAVPFRECFRDMVAEGRFSEVYLISKTRKAVIDKCLSYPYRVLGSFNADRNGEIDLEGFLGSGVKVRSGSDGVSIVGRRGDVFELRNGDGVSVSLKDLSLSDIQRLGERMLEIKEVIREARHAYIKGLETEVRPDMTASDEDVRRGVREGLLSLYDGNFPMEACRSVAQTYAPDHAGDFDLSRHTFREIDNMMRAVRAGKASVGFPEKRNKKIIETKL